MALYPQSHTTEHLAANIYNVSFPLRGSIFSRPELQPKNLADDFFAVGFSVVAAYANEHQEALIDPG